MYKILLLILVGVGALLAFAGYFWALSDWMEDISGGIYRQNYVEATLETSGIVLYTYLGIRFFTRNMGSFR
ncbi:hypothetical protein [Spirosoma sp. KNUC1025]|uniref:hypothetical protein n=1 Tax=Spirosoma sp. KNUC1025 TaxID=2894082 RepID=UPI003862E285|nr:hypothetical protein LN737_25080 [Spirosoma sp. KNUC1025]